MIDRAKKATWYFFLGLLIVVAISLSVIRLLLLTVGDYKTELERKIYQMTEIPVKISVLGSNMRGINPEIVLEKVSVLPEPGSKKSPIKLEELRIGINLIDLIFTQQILPSSSVTLVGVKLSIVRELDGRLSIVGLNAGESKQPYWLLKGGQYEVLKSEITWLDKQRNTTPVIFESIDFLIKNDPDSQGHEIHLISQLPKAIGKSLRVSMAIQGNVFEAGSVEGVVYIKGDDIRLAEVLTGEKPLGLEIISGVGDFEIWSQWEQSKNIALTGNIQAKNLRLKRQKKTFKVESLRTGFNVSNQLSGWQVGVTNFIAKTDNKTRRAATFDFSGNAELNQLAASITFVDLEQLSELVHFFAPLDKKKKALLAKLKLKGQIKDFSGYLDTQNNSYAVNGVFENVFSSALTDFPQIENLTGSVQGTNDQGEIGLTTLKGSLFFSKFFRQPIFIEQLFGKLSWKQLTDYWLIQSDQLILNVKDAETKSKLKLKISKNDKSIFMDLHSSFSKLNDVSTISEYYPVSIMHENILNWLDNAFVSGQIKKGGLLVYGELDQFPFNHGQGVFEVLLDATKVELQFAPDWPHLTNVNAEILFQKDSLMVTAEHAEVNGMNITQTLVQIPSFKNSNYLLVEGRAQGRVTNGLRFLQETPLHHTVDMLLDQTIPSGFLKVELDFKVPFVDTLSAEVNGVARLKQAALNIKSINLDVIEIVGDLKFNEMGLIGDNVSAKALGYSVLINIDSNEFSTSVSVDGKTDFSQLQKQFSFLNTEMLTTERIRGETDYRVMMDSPAAEGEKTILNINTDLLGISIDLPGLLKKEITQGKGLNLNLALSDQYLFPLSINYNDNIKVEMNVDKQQGTMHSAHIVYGNGLAVIPIEKGITIDINQDALEISQWVSFFGDLDNGNQATSQSINKISVISKDLQWKNSHYGGFEFLAKTSEQQWLGSLDCSAAKGTFTIPFDRNGNDKIKLKMDYLNLSEIMTFNFQTDGFGSGELPLIDVFSEQLLWQSENIGRFEIESERVIDGIKFNRISVSAEGYEIEMSADWSKQAQGSLTRFSGILSADDMGGMLSHIGIANDIKETSANIGYSGHWPNSPFHFSAAEMDAKINAQLKNGRISSIEPGFGRVLGLIAIEQWVKRLSLDFGDLYKKGLSFNSISGSFEITKGKASTNDLLVDAIPARITIKGDADLVEKTLDYNISVVPKSAGAIPIVGHIVGEIAGSISEGLISDYEEGYFFGSKYKITGSWDDIEVTSVDK